MGKRNSEGGQFPVPEPDISSTNFGNTSSGRLPLEWGDTKFGISLDVMQQMIVLFRLTRKIRECGELLFSLRGKPSFHLCPGVRRVS